MPLHAAQTSSRFFSLSNIKRVHQHKGLDSSDDTILPRFHHDHTDANDALESPASSLAEHVLLNGDESRAVGGGSHSISFFGSACLLAQNIATSGMLQIPGLFQSVGWLPASLAFVIVSSWSTAAALYLTRVIQRMPGNAAFNRRIEFGRAAQALLPRWAYLVVVFVLCAAFISQNISNIIVSAQAIDDALLSSIGTSCALAIHPQPPGGFPFFCISVDSDHIVSDSPYSGYVVSLGFCILAALTLPLSYIALDSNVVFQVIGEWHTRFRHKFSVSSFSAIIAAPLLHRRDAVSRGLRICMGDTVLCSRPSGTK
jgi:hypothetical protein